MANPLPYGLLPDPFDPRDVWIDEIVAGDEKPLPKSYETPGLSFEPQGAWPFCASFCATKMAEYAIKRRTGVSYDLSQPHLFFHSGGSREGSTFRGNLDAAKNKGLVSYAKCPMPDDIWDTAGFDVERLRALSVPFGDIRIDNYARVTPDREAIKRAISRFGLVMVGVAASGGYWADRAKRPAGKPDNHATILKGWAEDGAWICLDSLQPRRDFDGTHSLAPDYQLTSAHVVTEFPEDWRLIVANERQAPPNNENYYGKRRDLALEQRVASQMLLAFQSFQNESVLHAAGRFWLMYVRAVAYGGYSLSYTKWGQWKPGDIINDCYNWRRTGLHLFDFDLPRSLN